MRELINKKVSLSNDNTEKTNIKRLICDNKLLIIFFCFQYFAS